VPNRLKQNEKNNFYLFNSLGNEVFVIFEQISNTSTIDWTRHTNADIYMNKSSCELCKSTSMEAK